MFNFSFGNNFIPKPILDAIDVLFLQNQNRRPGENGEQDPPWFFNVMSKFSSLLIKRYKSKKIDPSFPDKKVTLISGHTHVPQIEGFIANAGCYEPLLKYIDVLKINHGIMSLGRLHV
jgi:hypothetical protein